MCSRERLAEFRGTVHTLACFVLYWPPDKDGPRGNRLLQYKYISTELTNFIYLRTREIKLVWLSLFRNRNLIYILAYCRLLGKLLTFHFYIARVWGSI